MMSSPDDSNNISRSGRVRKKSSKLTDFQSPEDVTAVGVAADALRRQRRPSNKKDGGNNSGTAAGTTSSSIFDPMEDSDPEEVERHLSGTRMDADLDMDIDHFDFKLEDLKELQDFDDDFSDSKRTEIIKKPANLPDASLDERRNRVTPFLLWAKHMKGDVMRDNPGIGPAHMKIKLGELWNTVPKAEKLVWSKKVKKLLNKSQSPQKTPAANMNTSIASQETKTIPGLGKTTETEAINIASHLKLLGESLSIIGERLTEHEGQIAVSGSLSVLLDSLLCAMGPLVCLTTRVPELNGAAGLTLNKTLDNVAYIMPGL